MSAEAVQKAHELALDRLREKNPRIIASPRVVKAVAEAIESLASCGQDDLEALAAFGVARGLVVYYSPSTGG